MMGHMENIYNALPILSVLHHSLYLMRLSILVFSVFVLIFIPGPQSE